MSDNNTDNAKAAAIVLIAGAIIVAGAYIIKEVMEALNLKDTKEEKDQEKKEQRAEAAGYFDETFLTTNIPMGVRPMLLTDKNVTAKAQGIKDSIGLVKDDPDRIKAIFDSLKTQSQVTFLAIKFKRMFNLHLLSFLREKLDTDQQKKVLSEILAKIDRLPKYTVK